jgi:hypothetical protein
MSILMLPYDINTPPIPVTLPGPNPPADAPV